MKKKQFVYLLHCIVDKGVVDDSMRFGIEASHDCQMIGKGFRWKTRNHVLGATATIQNSWNGRREFPIQIVGAKSIHTNHQQRGNVESKKKQCKKWSLNVIADY